MWRSHLHYIPLLLLGSCLTTSAFAAPTASIRAVGYSALNPTITGMAPLAVHVNGLGSNLDGGTEITTRYDWDFGDLAGRHQRLTGFGGAHVYDQGNYTLTLTVTNEAGESDSRSISVSVQPPARQTVYVSAAGNDSANGSTPATAVRSLARAGHLAVDNGEILFRRGDRFDGDTTLNLDGLTNVRIGAFGSGNRPVFDISVPTGPWGQDVINIDHGTRDVIIEDLRFEMSNMPPSEDQYLVRGIHMAGSNTRNITVRDCHFNNLTYNIAATMEGANMQPATGVLVTDNTAGDVGHYHTWTQASDVTVLGNTVENSLNGHVVRAYADRVFVYDNDFGSAGYTPAQCQAIQGHNNCLGYQVLSLAEGRHHYVADNVFRSYTRIGYFAPDTASSDVVMERNLFIRTHTGFIASISVFPGSQRIAIRNNVFDGEQTAIMFDWLGLPTTASDVWIQHNTMLHPGPHEGFIYALNTTPTNIYVEANLYLQPNLVGAGVWNDYPAMISAEALTGWNLTNNAWQTPLSGPPHWVANQGSVSQSQWANLPQVTGDWFHTLSPSDLDCGYAPPPGPGLASGPAPRGVVEDFHRQTRPAITTIGAVEQGAAPCAQYRASVSGLAGGSTAQFQITGAKPGSTQFLAGSLKGLGHRSLANLNTWLDLDRPILLGTAVADGTGNASIAVSIPQSGSSVELWFQVIEQGGHSRAVLRTVP